MRRLDLTGQRFGSLVVLQPSEPYIKPSGTKITQWLCECDCGNTTVVRTEYLRNGHTISCGCACGRIDRIGKRYGRLIVIKYVGNGKHLCKCDCGNEVEVKTYNLANDTTKSCGCFQKDATSQANLKDLTGVRFGKLTVIRRVENNRSGHVCYLCNCDCGGSIVVDAGHLKVGKTNSCGCIKSKGEMCINNILKENDICYLPQYSFDDWFMSSGKRPIYDFVVFNDDNSISHIVEYDGKQHFEYSGNGWDNEENFLQTKRRDYEKNNLAFQNNIPIIRIPYWHYNNLCIGDLLLDTTTFLVKENDNE